MKKVNKKAKFCKKKTVQILMLKYTVRLKSLKNFNLKINITRFV